MDTSATYPKGEVNEGSTLPNRTMADAAQAPRKLTVFIASPGDVKREREAAKRVIRRLSREMAPALSIEPISWDLEPMLATGNFQTQIPPVAEADVALFIFWSRLGTPLPNTITRADGSHYASGTEFEYEHAIAASRRGGKPAVLVYRKTLPDAVSLDSLPVARERLQQKEALDGFLERNGFVGDSGAPVAAASMTFDGLADFERRFERHLRRLVAGYVGRSLLTVAPLRWLRRAATLGGLALALGWLLALLLPWDWSAHLRWWAWTYAPLAPFLALPLVGRWLAGRDGRLARVDLTVVGLWLGGAATILSALVALDSVWARRQANYWSVHFPGSAERVFSTDEGQSVEARDFLKKFSPTTRERQLASIMALVAATRRNAPEAEGHLDRTNLPDTELRRLRHDVPRRLAFSLNLLSELSARHALLDADERISPVLAASPTRYLERWRGRQESIPPVRPREAGTFFPNIRVRPWIDLSSLDLSGLVWEQMLSPLKGFPWKALPIALLRGRSGSGRLHLQGANLQASSLVGAVIDGARLARADLSGATLDRAALCDADLRETVLGQARLRRTALCAADLRGAWLVEADMRGANLSFVEGGSDLRRAKLDDAVLARADLRHLDSMAAASARGAIFRDANLDCALIGQLRELREYVLLRTEARRGDTAAGRLAADFRSDRRVDFGGADFSGACLRGALLINVNLAGADLSGAQLEHAVLLGADLTETRGVTAIQLDGAFIDEGTKLPRSLTLPDVQRLRHKAREQNLESIVGHFAMLDSEEVVAPDERRACGPTAPPGATACAQARRASFSTTHGRGG